MLTAYSDLSLFEPVDLSLNDDDFVVENKKFILPVCIEAIPQIEFNGVYLVKNTSNGIIFAPRKADAMQFSTVESANNYINNVLKPRYGDKWGFVLWSYSALVK